MPLSIIGLVIADVSRPTCAQDVLYYVCGCCGSGAYLSNAADLRKLTWAAVALWLGRRS